ncbi:MAG TPA: hypothetical protein QGF58_23995 [Myxococcota bacterium]|nr:hypothetical protein [Myxococcota bacterium]
MHGFHIISNRRGWGLLARDTTERRELARTVLDIGEGYGLLFFCAPDTHLHSVVSCERRRAGRCARATEAALTVRLGYEDGFAQATIRPIANPGHRNNLRDYVLGQHDHHGVEADRLREASNVLDLLGARLLGAHTRGPVRRLVPRTTRAALLAHLDLEALPEGFPPSRLPGAVRLASAGAYARTDLRRRLDASAVRVAAGEGLGPKAIAALLDLSRTTVYRATRGSQDEEAEGALRRAAALLHTLG